jgi:Ala-tRNA(Pro) deacylase
MTMGASAPAPADPGLLEWLARHDVEYEVHQHAQAFTALSVAKAEGVDPHTVAKVVAVITTDGQRVLIALDTTDRLDLRKAAAALHADSVRLLTEAELAALAPTCEIGAMPAVGQLFGIAMLADHAIRDDRDISFNAEAIDAACEWSARAGNRRPASPTPIRRRPGRPPGLGTLMTAATRPSRAPSLTRSQAHAGLDRCP